MRFYTRQRQVNFRLIIRKSYTLYWLNSSDIKNTQNYAEQNKEIKSVYIKSRRWSKENSVKDVGRQQSAKRDKKWQSDKIEDKNQCSQNYWLMMWSNVKL